METFNTKKEAVVILNHIENKIKNNNLKATLVKLQDSDNKAIMDSLFDKETKHEFPAYSIRKFEGEIDNIPVNVTCLRNAPFLIIDTFSETPKDKDVRTLRTQLTKRLSMNGYKPEIYAYEYIGVYICVFYADTNID
jgi:hypothetical protein